MYFAGFNGYWDFFWKNISLTGADVDIRSRGQRTRHFEVMLRCNCEKIFRILLVTCFSCCSFYLEERNIDPLSQYNQCQIQKKISSCQKNCKRKSSRWGLTHKFSSRIQMLHVKWSQSTNIEYKIARGLIQAAFRV